MYVIAAPQTLSMPSAPPTLTQTPTTSHSSPFFITPISSAPEETFPLSVFLDFPVTAQSSPVKMSAPCTMSRACPSGGKPVHHTSAAPITALIQLMMFGFTP